MRLPFQRSRITPRGALSAAVFAAAVACADPVSSSGPRVSVSLLDAPLPEGVVVAGDGPGRLAVVARIRFACATHPLVPSVADGTDTLTLVVERRFPSPCELGAPPERAYRAVISRLPSGPTVLRVVHRYPEALVPPPPDTVYLGPASIP